MQMSMCMHACVHVVICATPMTWPNSMDEIAFANPLTIHGTYFCKSTM